MMLLVVLMIAMAGVTFAQRGGGGQGIAQHDVVSKSGSDDCSSHGRTCFCSGTWSS